MYIQYFASDYSLGEMTSIECNQYRNWAETQIKSRFPEHEVEVINQSGSSSSLTNDVDNEDEIEDFCSRLWDRCDEAFYG